MPLRLVKVYTRDMARAAPNVLFVFGDNMRREGYGGQARELRGEPNAVGIPTKWKPRRVPDAYFTDKDLSTVKEAIDVAFDRLERHLREGGDVVWPVDGVGSGLAMLPERAPAIDRYIQGRLARLWLV